MPLPCRVKMGASGSGGGRLIPPLNFPTDGEAQVQRSSPGCKVKNFDNGAGLPLSTLSEHSAQRIKSGVLQRSTFQNAPLGARSKRQLEAMTLAKDFSGGAQLMSDGGAYAAESAAGNRSSLAVLRRGSAKTGKPSGLVLLPTTHV